jgi:hypothetical protein
MDEQKLLELANRLIKALAEIGDALNRNAGVNAAMYVATHPSRFDAPAVNAAEKKIRDAAL